ncbi:hypothetical protein HDU84_009103, partial [Entophlyctis sp. JEL0112]
SSRVHKLAVLNTYYAPRAVFSDPIVAVTGTHAITQQYLFLSLFPRVRSSIVRTTWCHLGEPLDIALLDSEKISINDQDRLSTCSNSRNETVVIDAFVIFTLLPLAFPAFLADVPMRIVSVFKFDSSGRIILHEDLWSIRELLGGFGGGILGVILNALRYSGSFAGHQKAQL